MLFSMFVSYYLWRRYSREDYVLYTALFVVMASLFSTFMGYLYVFFLALPFMFVPWLLSFPFSSIVEVVTSDYIPVSYNLHFLSVRILSFNVENAQVVGVLFFLSINLVGAVLGYWIGKMFFGESKTKEHETGVSKAVEAEWRDKQL